MTEMVRVKNTKTDVSVECEIFEKTTTKLVVLLPETTIKLSLFKKNGKFIGSYSGMEFLLEEQN